MAKMRFTIHDKETGEEIGQGRSELDWYRFKDQFIRENNIIDHICVRHKIKKVKTDKKLLDEACEKLWKKIVKYDAGYKCEYCGNELRQLHSHHIFTRERENTRWDLNNGMCLCSIHHKLGEKNENGFAAHVTPSNFRKWADKYKGVNFMNNLETKSLTRYKLNKANLQMQLHYLQNEARIRGL